MSNNNTKNIQINKYKYDMEKFVRKLTRLEAYWCLLYLGRKKIPSGSTDRELIPDKYCKQRLVNFLIKIHWANGNNSPYLTLLKHLEKQIADFFIPEEVIAWFSNDDIAMMWISMVFISSEKTDGNRIFYTKDEVLYYLYECVHLRNFENIGRKLKFLPNGYETILEAKLKIKTLNMLRKNWNLSKVQQKNISWIDQKNKKQIDWMYEYMKKKNRLILPHQFQFSDKNTLMKYNHIIASLNFSVFINVLDVSDNDIQSKIIKQIYNAWQQKQHREKIKKDKKTMLSSDNLKQIKQLAKENDLDESKMIDNIIDFYIRNHSCKG